MGKKPMEPTGTILLVDDESLIIDVGTAILERLGYSVQIAHNGQRAIEMIEDKSMAIDLIILDMIMPDMDGAKTYDRIRSIAPQIPVLLSSGYSMNEQTDQLIHLGCKGFIQKPFSVSELAEKVRSILRS